MFYVLRPVLFPNLSLFFRTMLFEYPSVLSRFCLILRATRLSNKLLQLGYAKELLRSWLRKFYGRYGDLIKQYEGPLSWIFNDILWPGNIQWQPTTDQTLYLAVTLLPNSTYRILRGFHYRTFATGVACRQGMLTPTEPGPVLWDLHMFYLLRPTHFPNLSWFFGLCSSNIPRYFLGLCLSH